MDFPLQSQRFVFFIIKLNYIAFMGTAIVTLLKRSVTPQESDNICYSISFKGFDHPVVGDCG